MIYADMLAKRWIHPETGCWEWLGAKSGAGYGVISSRANGRTYNTYLHRAMAWLCLGYDGSSDLEVCHRCNVKNCFNPDHLYLAPHIQNMADAGRDGLMRYGQKHHAVKLTEEVVAEMKKKIRNGEITWRKAAERYGVATGTVQDVVEGRTWRRVEV